MVGREWTTAPQKLYLESMFPSYLAVDELPNNSKALGRFWAALNEEFFQRFPETSRRFFGGDKRSLEDLDAVSCIGSGPGCELHVQAKKKDGSLFNLLKKTKATRPLRAVEVYHRMYKTKVTAELRGRGYDELTESAVARRALEAGPPEVQILTSDEVKAAAAAEAEATKDRVDMNRKLRMTLQRTTVTEMFEAESEAVKNDVHKEMAVLNEERARTVEENNGEGERTPEQMQHGIDQLTEVVEKVLSAIGRETGWHACLLVGGPSPRREGGGISTKTICLGTTPLGADFQAFHTNFDKHVKTEFAKYLKRAFPQEVRKSRALVPDGAVEIADALDGLMPIDPDSDYGNLLGDYGYSDTLDDLTGDTGASSSAFAGPSFTFHPPTFDAAGEDLVPPHLPSPPPQEQVAAAFQPAPSFMPSVPKPRPANQGSGLEGSVNRMSLRFAPLAGMTSDTISRVSTPTPPHNATSVNRTALALFTASLAEATAAVSAVSHGEGPAVRTAGPLAALPPAQAAASAPAVSPVVASVLPSVPVSDIAAAPVVASRLPAGPASAFPDGAAPALPASPASVITPAPAPAAVPDRPAPALPAGPVSVITPAPAPAVPDGGALPAVPASAIAPPPAHPAPIPATAPYIISRPMGNVPRGHPLAAATAPAKRGRGRPRKQAAVPSLADSAVSEADSSAVSEVNPTAPMTAAARGESARIHRIEAEQRETRLEMLRRSQAVADQAGAIDAEEKRVAAARCNPAGGADLVVVSRPKRTLKPARNLDGSPSKEDAEMLNKLEGRGKKAGVTGTKRKATAARQQDCHEKGAQIDGCTRIAAQPADGEKTGSTQAVPGSVITCGA
ncbi:hypothetical protein B0H14DRAFT_2632701 [Mycena olivaceomarginata]|nr:hypothetical protein B0H14DRAFT_2632701 [Mycena olivaceomarginata]